MRILAIDASTKASGFAVFEGQELTAHMRITASSSDLIQRIKKMTDNMATYLKQYEIDTIVLEEVRPDKGGTNPKTLKALMWLQAAIAFKVHDDFPKVKIEYVYPSSWRAACGIHTGRGIKRESLKEADIAFAEKTYNLSNLDDDTADAICIGHSYVMNQQDDLNWA